MKFYIALLIMGILTQNFVLSKFWASARFWAFPKS